MLPFYFNIAIFINSMLFLMSNRSLPWLFWTASALLLSLYATAKTPENFKANNNSLVFIENKAQIVDQNGKHRKDIDFKLDGKGLNIFVGNGQIHYQFPNHDSHEKKDAQDVKVETYRLDVTLVGANKHAELITEEKQDYYENYYLAQCPDGAVAHSYKKITYKNVYSNIDWVLYAKGNELKYDFVVHEGGNIKDIQLKYDGATALAIQDGTLIATTPFGSITEQVPYSYDAISQKSIPSSFILKNNILTFNIETNYKELIIDPTLIWSANFATSSSSFSNVKLDNAGNIYQGGSIDGTNNVATTGAHQTTYGGSLIDGYLAKYNNSGSIIWSTYYGGSDTDEVFSVTTDASNNVIIAGYTNSNTAIATTGSHQPTFGGGMYDCFVAKFSSSGTRIWGTYYGGSGNEGYYVNLILNNIVCDGSNIYLANNTTSLSGIATSGSYQPNTTTCDGFVVKFNSSGVRQWGFYFVNPITAIALDNTGLYIGFVYLGNPGPILTKFNSSGTLLWNFTIPGNAAPYIYAICPDRFGYVYISGSTLGNSSLITKNLLIPLASANGLYKFSNSGNLIWGSRIFSTRIEDIACDSFGNAFLTGLHSPNLLPSPLATPCTYQVAGPGQGGASVAIYDSAGVNIWATDYLSQTEGFGIEADNANIYFGGDGVQSPNIGHGFLAKFSLDTLVAIGHPYFDTLRCQKDTFKVTYGVLYNFKPGNTFTVQLSDATGSFASPTIIGSTSSSSGGTITCIIPANMPYGTGYRIRIVASNPFKISCDDGYNISIGTQAPAKPVSSSDAPVCKGSTLHLYTSTSTPGVYYKWIGPNNYASSQQNPTITNIAATAAGNYIAQAYILGCHTDDTTSVIVKPLPDQTIVTANTPICAGDTLKITNSDTTSGITYSWTGPASFSSTTKNPFISNAAATATGNYIVTATLNGCTFKDTAIAVVNIVPVKPVITSNTPLCEGDSLRLNSSSTTPGASYSWTGVSGFTSAAKDTGIGNTVVSQSGDYMVTAMLLNCSSKDTETVLIKPNPQNVTVASNTPVCPGTTLNLTSNSSTSAVTWSWTGPGSYSATTQNPSRANMQTGWAGTYTVTAILNGCSVSANTNVASYITTPTPVVGANNPVCYGGTLNLTASNIAGAIYSWFGPNNYHSNAQNAIRLNMGAADAGVYTVNANVNGCISQTAVTQPITLISGPSVSAYASPSSTICTGASVALVAVPTNIGTNPATYNWFKNGNNTGGTGTSYITPSPANGDVFYVMMTAGTACNTAIASNNITITTLPTTPPPAATIVASPGTDVWPYLNVTFSISSLTNGGITSGFQWKLNGTSVAGATKNTWSTTELKDGDSVCLWVTSSDQCATPKSTLSNCLKMKVPTGVGPLNPLGGDFAIYPNPVTKQLTIEGATVGTTVQVNNIIGQTVYRGVIRSSKETINTSQWAPGAYLLHLSGKDRDRVVRKIIKE
jgi:hypothetical protein